MKRSKKHVKEISQICRREKAQKSSACRMQMQVVYVVALDYMYIACTFMSRPYWIHPEMAMPSSTFFVTDRQRASERREAKERDNPVTRVETESPRGVLRLRTTNNHRVQSYYNRAYSSLCTCGHACLSGARFFDTPLFIMHMAQQAGTG